jgi:hypothetical protein
MARWAAAHMARTGSASPGVGGSPAPVRPLRHEVHAQVRIQRVGNPAEHPERVALVVGVLDPGNDRLSGSDPLGQLSLREAPAGPEIVDLPRDVGVDALLLDEDAEAGVAADQPLEDLHGVGRGLGLGHRHGPSCTSFVKRVSLGVGTEQRPVETGLGDLAVRHRRFLGDQMTQDGASLPCEEVEDPMVNPPIGDPELVDTVAKVLRLRASQLIPALTTG